MDDATRPLYAQTQAVLAALDRGNAAALGGLVAEDLTVVDSGASGAPLVLHTREALLERLRERRTEPRSSTVLAFDGHPDRESGWSAIRFRRDAAGPGGGRELCSATLLWTLTTDGWKLTRWHCTVERREDAPS